MRDEEEEEEEKEEKRITKSNFSSFLFSASVAELLGTFNNSVAKAFCL